MSYSEELQQEALENLNIVRKRAKKLQFNLDAPYPNPNDLKDPGNRNTFNHFMFYYNKYKDDEEELNNFFQYLYDNWRRRSSMPLYHILNFLDKQEATDSEYLSSDIDGGKRKSKKIKTNPKKSKKNPKKSKKMKRTIRHK